jgi:hypothetical protein
MHFEKGNWVPHLISIEFCCCFLKTWAHNSEAKEEGNEEVKIYMNKIEQQVFVGES